MTSQRTDSAKNGADAPSKASFKPYEGPEPYVFVSYSHKDSGRVLPILDAMHAAGYRVWYDEGIPWSSEWPAEIEKHLSACAVCLAFLSASAMESDHCRREIHVAATDKKPILPVYLEDVKLEHGLKLELSLYQAVQWYKPGEAARFIAKLDGQKAFSVCKIPVKTEKPITGADSNTDSGAENLQPPTIDPEILRGIINPIYHTEIIKTVPNAISLLLIAYSLTLALCYFGLAKIIFSDDYIIGMVFFVIAVLFVVWSIFFTFYNIPRFYLHNRSILEVKKNWKYGKGLFNVALLLYPQNHQGPRDVTSLVIGDGFTVIGRGTFKNYTELTNVTIPDSVKRIHANAFRNCVNLRTVSVPLNAKISPNAFSDFTTVIRRGEPPKIK